MSVPAAKTGIIPGCCRSSGFGVATATAPCNIGALINPEGSNLLFELVSCLIQQRTEEDTANGGAVVLWIAREAAAGTSRVNLVPPSGPGPLNETRDRSAKVRAARGLVANCNVGEGGAATTIAVAETVGAGTSAATIAAVRPRIIRSIMGGFGTDSATGLPIFGINSIHNFEMVTPVSDPFGPALGPMGGPGEMFLVQLTNPTTGERFKISWVWREWTEEQLEALDRFREQECAR